MKHRYIAPYEAFFYSESRKLYKRIWDNELELRNCVRISLENQHNDRPLFAVPLEIHMHFHFTIHRDRHRKPLHKVGDPHQDAPELGILTRVMCVIGTDTLWKNDKLITKISATKQWDRKGKIILDVIELEK